MSSWRKRAKETAGTGRAAAQGPAAKAVVEGPPDTGGVAADVGGPVPQGTDARTEDLPTGTAAANGIQRASLSRLRSRPVGRAAAWAGGRGGHDSYPTVAVSAAAAR